MLYLTWYCIQLGIALTCCCCVKLDIGLFDLELQAATTGWPCKKDRDKWIQLCGKTDFWYIHLDILFNEVKANFLHWEGQIWKQMWLLLNSYRHRPANILSVFQGTWMGYLTSLNALARVIGPLVMGRIYTFYGMYATYGLSFGLLATCLLITSCAFKRLTASTGRKISPLSSPNSSQLETEENTHLWITMSLILWSSLQLFFSLLQSDISDYSNH